MTSSPPGAVGTPTLPRSIEHQVVHTLGAHPSPPPPVRRTTSGAAPARAAGRAAVAGTALLTGAALLGAFLLWTTVLSHVSHTRSQQVAYAEFRTELSSLTAPTGQLDLDGAPLALGTPVALLTTPRLGLTREVVFEGTTSGVLARGPGHRRSSVLPGQPGVSTIYGRSWSYGGPFGGIPSMRPGNELTLTTGQGEHTYRVVDIRRPGDPVPLPPAEGEGRLTLVTATGRQYAPSAVVYLDAELVSPAVPAPARVLGARDLAPAEEALAGDAGHWPALFLSLQLLALASLGVALAARRWSRAQAWLLGFPVLGALSLLSSREALALLPNLL